MENLRNASIFIVDDAKTNLDILVDALSDDYQVSVALNGEKALEFIKKYTPDLILLDIVMDGISGYDVCRSLKENPVTKNIPIIFLSGMTESKDKSTGFKLGAVDYITKPFDIVEIKERIKIHLELKFSRELLKNQNKLLEEKVLERTREIELLKNVFITSLASLVETRDYETGEHIYRTQSYVQTLAEEIKKDNFYPELFTSEYVDLLHKTSPLHDIGKIGISDSILLKPDKLTQDEFNEMKKHSVYGYLILERIERQLGKNKFISFAKDIAHYHHEKWDGSGYPEGLKGNEIPMSARLMALADVYDALTTKRIYKPIFSHEKAREIIINESGKHFDPFIVDIFLRVEDEFIKISKKR